MRSSRRMARSSVGRSGRRRARRRGARGAARKRHQRDVPRALDGHAQPALVPRAHPGHSPWKNLPALLHELRQNVCSLIVDEIHLLDTEFAYFLFAEVLPLAAWAPARAARTWPATSCARFAPLASVTAFPTRRRAGSSCLFLFLCHTVSPFPACIRPSRTTRARPGCISFQLDLLL